MSKHVAVQPDSRVSHATPLSAKAAAYARQSKSLNTRRAYAAQIKLWLAFAAREGILDAHRSGGWQSPDPIAVANWLAARADAGAAYSTLRTAIAAIRAASISAGFAFDSKHPALETVMKGIGRAHARAPRQAEPLRGTDVRTLLQGLGASLLARRDGALLALAYVFGLRRSEVVGLDWHEHGDGDGFVLITAREIVLTLVRSKTSRVGEVQTVGVPRATNPAAVRAIETWVDAAGIARGTALLRSVSKAGKPGGRLSPQSVSLIVKALVAEHHERRGVPAALARDEGRRYSSHSLRVGVAVTAAEAGASAREIGQLGRWSSMEMPARYARRAEDAKTSVHLRPGVGLE